MKHLDDRDDAFWKSLSFLKTLNEQKFPNEDISFHHARYFITGRIINHIVGSYQLLKMGLEDESLVMLRQSYDNTWLLKYFIENPNDIHEWMKRKSPKNIEPWQRRKVLDNQKHAARIYRELSNVVHSNYKTFWGVCTGGMFNPTIVDNLFGYFLDLIDETIEYFIEIMDSLNIKIQNHKTEIADLYQTTTQDLWMAIYVTAYFKDPIRVEGKMGGNGESDILEYINNRYILS